MKCSICGIQIDSLEEAAEEGWEPYFYDGETEYELACHGCAETFLHEGEHLVIAFAVVEKDGRVN